MTYSICHHINIKYSCILQWKHTHKFLCWCRYWVEQWAFKISNEHLASTSPLKWKAAVVQGKDSYTKSQLVKIHRIIYCISTSYGSCATERGLNLLDLPVDLVHKSAIRGTLSDKTSYHYTHLQFVLVCGSNWVCIILPQKFTSMYFIMFACSLIKN